MYCSNCGTQTAASVKFCPNCGANVAASSDTTPQVQKSEKTLAKEPGRGGMILTFGILSLLLLGPILGIPAWVMGHRDLKKIREGIIDLAQRGNTKGGMVLGIIGTFVSPGAIMIIGVMLAVGLSMFTAQSVNANRDAVIADITNIAANAYQYRIRPISMGGGGGSYIGYELPRSLSRNENGTYSVEVASYIITVRGTSAEGYGEVTAHYGEDGRLASLFEFTGQFQ